MLIPAIQLPYLIVSRVDYDWLLYSRNALLIVTVLLGFALYDSRRTLALPNSPKDESATPASGEESSPQ
jgi:hypothetical protein